MVTEKEREWSKEEEEREKGRREKKTRLVLSINKIVNVDQGNHSLDFVGRETGWSREKVSRRERDFVQCSSRWLRKKERKRNREEREKQEEWLNQTKNPTCN